MNSSHLVLPGTNSPLSNSSNRISRNLDPHRDTHMDIRYKFFNGLRAFSISLSLLLKELPAQLCINTSPLHPPSQCRYSRTPIVYKTKAI